MSGAFAQFLGDIGNHQADADRVAEVFARDLGKLVVADLPSEAQLHWRDAARLLKSSPERPIPDKAIAAVRSWPVSRVAKLLDLVGAIHSILAKEENQRLEDEIRDKIRRHYL